MLLFLDRFYRTSVKAGTADHALVLVDLAMTLSHGDRCRGAVLLTESASDAAIRNNVHFESSLQTSGRTIRRTDRTKSYAAPGEKVSRFAVCLCYQLMQVYIAYGGRGSPVVVRK